MLNETIKARRKALNRRRRGMSLIEIMVAVAILVMLSAGVAVLVIPRMEEARVNKTILEIKETEKALQLYKVRKGKYPDVTTGFKALVDSQDLSGMPKDGWNNDLIYMLEQGNPLIKSYGADGQEGGSDTNADITNKSAKQ